MDIPEEYIKRLGQREIADFFAKLIMDHQDQVPIFIEDFTSQLFFVNCDKRGYPQRRYFEYLTFMSFPKTEVFNVNSDPVSDITEVYKKVIEIDRPLVLYHTGDNMSTPYIFMWKGIITQKQEIPIESLDVKYLMKLAQKTIEDRNGLVINEAIKNKLIK